MRYSRFFKNYAALVEAKCHVYTPSNEGCTIDITRAELKLVLGITHKTLGHWIDQDFLKLGESQHYYGSIPSHFIEEFLTISQYEPLLQKPRMRETLSSPKQLDLKEIAQQLDIHYETARKLTNMGWFDLDQLCNDAKAAKGYSLL